MSTIAVISASIRADTKQFAKGLKRAETRIGRFAQKMRIATFAVRAFGIAITKLLIAKLAGAFKRLLLRISRFGTTLTAIVVGALAFWTKSTFSAIDATAKFADRIGISTEALGGLQLAAKISGVTITNLQLGLQRMTRRVSEAAKGFGEAKAALAELGLDALKISKLSPDKQFEAIADAMEKVTSQSDRVRLAMKLFDSEGVALVNTMRGGSKALQRFRAEAIKMGFAFNRIDAAKVEAANDSFTRLGATLQGIVNRIAVRLAPIIVLMNKKLAGFLNSGRGAAKMVDLIIDTTVRFIGKVVNLFSAIKAVFFEVKSFILRIASNIAKAIKFVGEGMARFIELTAEGLNSIGFIDRAAVRDAQKFVKELRSGLLSIGLSGFGFQVGSFIAEITANQAWRDFANDTLKNQVVNGFKAVTEEANKAATNIVNKMKRTEGLFSKIIAGINAGIGSVKEFGTKAFANISPALEKLKNEAQSIFDATRSPAERFTKRLMRLRLLLSAGLIDKETFGRALKDAMNSLKTEKSKFDRISRDVGQFRELDAANIAVIAGLNKMEKQIVEDPQLKETNILLTSIERGLIKGGGVGVAG